MSSDLKQKIAEILVDRLFLEVAAGEIGETDSLTDQYGVDSVRLFDMVIGLEEEFGISFADNELVLRNFDTLAQIRDQVQAKQNA